MFYDYLYLLFFIYIAFEAFYELFLRFSKKHIELKARQSKLKEENYFVYRINVLILPAVYSLWNTKVAIGISFYLVHHFFIHELMHKANVDTAIFDKWTTVGMYFAAFSAAVLSFIYSRR